MRALRYITAGVSLAALVLLASSMAPAQDRDRGERRELVPRGVDRFEGARDWDRGVVRRPEFWENRGWRPRDHEEEEEREGRLGIFGSPWVSPYSYGYGYPYAYPYTSPYGYGYPYGYSYTYPYVYPGNQFRLVIPFRL